MAKLDKSKHYNSLAELPPKEEIKTKRIFQKNIAKYNKPHINFTFQVITPQGNNLIQ